MKAHNDQALRKKCSVRLMSNHKWNKFFQTMAKYGSNLSGIEYHFTDTEQTYFGSAPTIQQVWATAVDDPVDGCGGPVEYKHIEKIMIPRIYTYRLYESGPLQSREQDIEPFLTALTAIGKFPVIETEDGVEVIGYDT